MRKTVDFLRFACHFFAVCVSGNTTPPKWRETGDQAVTGLSAKFQSTPPKWRETVPPTGLWLIFHRFQSTPPKWRETSDVHLRLIYNVISIHSPQVEGDQVSYVKEMVSGDFNPLPPSGGRPQQLCGGNRPWHFNPLPPSGGRRGRSVF